MEMLYREVIRKILKIFVIFLALMLFSLSCSYIYYRYIANLGYKVGFPLLVYWQVNIRGNLTPNYSWYLTNIMIDICIYAVISIVIVFLWNKFSKKTDA